MSDLSASQGEILVRVARQTITSLLGMAPENELDPADLSAPLFQEKRGVFVTLHKNGELRG
nr:AmmeMemoRadiSam system protein A [Deltaproteobacteria bacterium]